MATIERDWDRTTPMSSVRCAQRRCRTGLLFVARNRRRFLTAREWSNTRTAGWICPKHRPEGLEGALVDLVTAATDFAEHFTAAPYNADEPIADAWRALRAVLARARAQIRATERVRR